MKLKAAYLPIVKMALAYRAAHWPNPRAAEFSLIVHGVISRHPESSLGDDILTCISSALTQFIAECPIENDALLADAASREISAHFLAQENEFNLADACDYWRCGMLHYTSNGYRWIRNASIPHGAKPGAVATPYSRAIRKAFGTDVAKFHRYATHGELASLRRAA